MVTNATHAQLLSAVLVRSAHLRAAFRHALAIATQRTRAGKVAEARQVRDHLIAHLAAVG